MGKGKFLLKFYLVCMKLFYEEEKMVKVEFFVRKKWSFYIFKARKGMGRGFSE